MGQGGALFRCLSDFCQPRVRCVAAVHPFKKVRAVAVNDAQHVVKITSHPASQLSDALRFLCLPKLGFETPELREVVARSPGFAGWSGVLRCGNSQSAMRFVTRG